MEVNDTLIGLFLTSLIYLPNLFRYFPANGSGKNKKLKHLKKDTKITMSKMNCDK